ncbi:MAG: DUF1638 domain-containing protein [Verrucomicrobia bacterium]|nr:DUF1638 domain-containing protein [Verrucomicrobiota bacterium]
MFLKVLACEIAFREICHLAARSPHVVDLEFLTQGYHDIPKTGCAEIQKRIDAVPAGRYDAILLGYGLCSNILQGLTTPHTPLVVPRAHDCITFFLGSRQRYQQLFSERPGTYYYTSGWLECLQRRRDYGAVWGGASLPANAGAAARQAYTLWTRKYGEEEAQYLMQELNRWTQSYSHGVLIQFDFAQHLDLPRQVRQICHQHHWQYEEIHGDLALLQHWLDGHWDPPDFLVLQPGQKIAASGGPDIVAAEPAAGT